jgi:hypothetical protein
LNKPKKQSSKISRRNIISVSAVIGIAVLMGFFVLHSFTPVNSNTPVFASPTNISLKAVKSSQGNYHYQTTKGGKNLPNVEGKSPSITISKNNLVQIHLINEEINQPGIPSKHNLNIDEFNVHTKDLGYFQTDSITFLADKTGTFDYYCSFHSDMRGTITVIP